jgi:hypothetical protein
VCVSCGCGLPHDDHGDPRNITIERLKEAAEAANETVDCAAHNIESIVMHQFTKSETPSDVAVAVFKSSQEQRYTLGVAYPVNRPDVGVAQDGHIDYVGPEALEKAAWNFMNRGGNVGLDHAKGADHRGRVVESYIYRGPDWPQPNGYVVKSGDWLIGVIWAKEAWPEIKTGRKRGFSPQGAAKRRTPTPEALAALREPTRHL